MNKTDKIEINSLVQLNPELVTNKMFAGCILVVTEIKKWGVQGYVQSLGQNGYPGRQAYYRATWEEIEPVGYAEWVIE
jgi:hypothetical protein